MERNVRVTDRSSDRSIGVWANNIDQRLNVGITSTNDATYVAWQDDRNATQAYQAEDVYTASVKFDNAYLIKTSKPKRINGVVLVLVGVLAGVGVTLIVAPRIGRGRRTA